jgi:hypothetical protein
MDGESLEDFKDSFSYGERSNLNFKFLRRLTQADAAEVVRRVLEEAGHLLDHGDPGPLLDLVIAAQRDAYRHPPLQERYHYPDSPFTTPTRPVAEATVALLTSSGHFVDGEDPRPFGVEDMTQEEAERRIDDFLRAEPDLSTVPVSTPPKTTRVRHGGYDIGGAVLDRNVAFPIDHLRELSDDGVIGDLHPDAYSFVGAAAQGRILRHAAPAWADMLIEHGVDVVLLVPV